MAFTKNQLSAINISGTNIIVSAGAGSGKTAVLTECVFEHVTGQNNKANEKWNIDEMLVLTFTNAAAAEMKKRIRDKISKNEGNALSTEERNIQLNKIDSSYIMTFDAYALSLVKKYHYLLNVDKDVNLIDENIMNIKQDEILADILNEKYQAGDSKFENLIKQFCVKDDNSIKDAIIKINNRLALIYERENYVDSYEENMFSSENIDKLFNDYVDLLKNKISVIEKLVDEFSNHVSDYRYYYKSIDNLFNAKTYEDIRNGLMLLTDIPKIKTGDSNDDAKTIKAKIKTELDKLNELTVFDETQIKEQIINTKDNSLVLLELAQELNRRVLKYKRENNLYDYSDIFKMAIDLVSENKNIAEEIRDSFKEILIDEYQDTSDLQDEFINRISNNNVYMVGDIKQSIYQFRNANPKLFLDKYGQYADGKGGVAINLLDNFRSRKEVLNGVNVAFDRIMDLRIGGAEFASKHHMLERKEYDEIGKWKVNHSSDMEILTYQDEFEDGEYNPFEEYTQEEVEAFTIASDIKNKVESGYEVADQDEDGKMIVRPAKWSDFCILADRSNNFDLYKRVLTYLNIPCSIISDDKMDDSDLLTVIKSIFKYLSCLHNEDYGYEFKKAYMSVARSFLVEMKDSEIHTALANDEISETKLAEQLAKIAASIENKTISNILDEIIIEFDVYSKINRIGDVEDNFIKIDYLYQLAHTLNDIGYSYLDFNDYLDNVFSKDNNIRFSIEKGDNDVVRIMTIHKSKGLEFRICYYPSLTKRFNDSDKKDRFVFSKQQGIIIPTYIENRGLKDTIKKELFKFDYGMSDIGERIRLFYVAMTRAKEKLILICPLEDKDSGNKGMVDDNDRLSINSFAKMLNLIYDDLGPYQKQIDFKSINLSEEYKNPNFAIFKELKKTDEKIQIKQLEAIEPIIVKQDSYSKKAGLIDTKTKGAMDLGSKVHYYLETLDFINPDYSLIDDKYAGKIKDFLDSELMRDKGKAIIHKEYEFIYQEGNENKHGFIDLLMEYDDHFDIIDYKLSNVDDENYVKQLNGYREYIKSLSNKDVKCYLYSINSGEIKEIE